ncbi:sulfotransferase [Gymnodinialimonas sp. 2305UL16-5]|uniref:tetratricopeptide repeat-containing sulfotransferase family protein n=1 Tax=Gymnodinialimonas mytili TaxID=3126503 RepID=UPI0030AFEE2A
MTLQSPDPTRQFQDGLARFRAGRVAEARALFEALLKTHPNAPDPLFHLGRCLVAEGDRKGAMAAFQTALKGKPSDGPIWRALHGLLKGPAKAKLERQAAKAKIALGLEEQVRPILSAITKGRAAQVERTAVDLARATPGAFWPALALGEVWLALGKAATGPLEMARSVDPDHPRGKLALARAYLALGKVGRAEALLDQNAPGHAVALARLYRDIARPEAAVALLRDSKAKGVSVELALSLAACGESDAALKAADRAVSQGADKAALYRQVAYGLESAGDVAGAERALDAVLAVRATAPLLTHRAQLDQSAGDMAAAEARLAEAIAADPTHGEAFRAYANGRKVAADDPVFAQLQSALDRPDLRKPDRARLHFAAAKAAWDQKRDGDVFTHLTTANRLMAESYPYSFDADLAQARLLVGDASVVDGVRRDGPDAPVIFVTGLPRSGTTLVETILAAHPLAQAGGEMPFLSRALVPAMEALRDGTAQPDLFAAAGRRYLRAARRRAGDGVIVDKAISTFSRIGHTLAALPGANIVLVRRDPRDTGLSLYRNMFPEGLHRYAYDLTAMGRYIRLHEAVADFWHQRYPDRVHLIEYEALTQDPEPQIRALLEAVGLPWDGACLAPEAASRRIQTLSFAQARQPIGTASIAGWQKFETELQPLLDALEYQVDLTPDG